MNRAELDAEWGELAMELAEGHCCVPNDRGANQEPHTCFYVETLQRLVAAERAIVDREIAARAIRYAAATAEECDGDRHPHCNPNELCRIADRIESGEIEVPR